MFQNMIKKSRLHMRMPLAKFGFIQISGDEGGQILNISDEGLCFQTFAPIGNAKNLQFWFSLNLQDRIEANGQVAWLDAETKVGGLRFQNLTERAIKHIRAYATGGNTEGTCKKESIFAAAVTKRNSAESSAEPASPHLESSSALGTSIGNSPFYRPVDRQTQAHPTISPRVESTDLISLQRHLAVCRKRLIIGFMFGILAASSLALLLVPYFVNRARIAASQTRPAVTSTEKQATVQSNPSALAIPESTKNSAAESSPRPGSSHSYDAKLSKVNSAESASTFFG